MDRPLRWIGIWCIAVATFCTAACVSQFNIQYLDAALSSVQVTPTQLPADGNTVGLVHLSLYLGENVPAAGVVLSWTQTGAPANFKETSATTDSQGAALLHVTGTQVGTTQLAFFGTFGSQRVDLHLKGQIAFVATDQNRSETLRVSGYASPTTAGTEHNVTLAVVDANGAI